MSAGHMTSPDSGPTGSVNTFRASDYSNNALLTVFDPCTFYARLHISAVPLLFFSSGSSVQGRGDARGQLLGIDECLRPAP